MVGSKVVSMDSGMVEQMADLKVEMVAPLADVLAGMMAPLLVGVWAASWVGC